MNRKCMNTNKSNSSKIKTTKFSLQIKIKIPKWLRHQTLQAYKANLLKDYIEIINL